MYIDLNRIPDNVFFPVKLIRDVQKAVVSKYTDVSKGKAEVELVSPLGYKVEISKKELLDNFRLVNNKKIRMLGIKCNRPITVVGDGQREMCAVYIPTNCTVELDEGGSVSGQYIVCEINEENQPDKEQYFIVSKRLFQKLFVMSGDINSLIGAEPQQIDEYANNEVRNYEPVYQSAELPNDFSEKNQVLENQYTIVSKVVNSDNKIVALKIKDKETGQTQSIALTLLINYVNSGGIDGIKIEYQNGKPIIKYVKE